MNIKRLIAREGLILLVVLFASYVIYQVYDAMNSPQASWNDEKEVRLMYLKKKLGK